MLCPHCGSDRVQIDQITETKKKLRVGAAILLNPLALVVPKEKTTTRAQAVCQNCGWIFPPYQGITEIKPGQYNSVPAAPDTPASSGFDGHASAADALKKYKELLDMGAISQEEYDEKKAELLNIGSTLNRNTPIYRQSMPAVAELYKKSEDADTNLQWDPAPRPWFRALGWVFGIIALLMFLISLIAEDKSEAGTAPWAFAMIILSLLGLTLAFLFYSTLPDNIDVVKVMGWKCPVTKKWVFSILIALLSVLPIFVCSSKITSLTNSYSDNTVVNNIVSNSEMESDVLYPDVSEIVISSVITSDNLDSVGERTYVGENTVDGDMDTSWIVNTGSEGAAGAWIQYNFDKEYTIHGMYMVNGNVYKEGYYFSNGHVKEFRLDFSDGTSKTFTAQEVESRSLDSNVFYYDFPVNTTFVKLTVISSYIASKEEYRTNTAITEVEFF